VLAFAALKPASDIVIIDAATSSKDTPAAAAVPVTAPIEVVRSSNLRALAFADVSSTSATCVTSLASIPKALNTDVNACVVVSVPTIILPAASTDTFRISIASVASYPLDTMPRKASATSLLDFDVLALAASTSSL